MVRVHRGNLKSVRDADCCSLSETIEDGKFYASLLGHETLKS